MRRALAFLLALEVWSQTADKPTSFLVKLSNPVGSQISRPGDKISAVVISPEVYLGGRLSGIIREAAATRPARVELVFSELRHKGEVRLLTGTLVSFVNSKGHPSVDEQGHPLAVEKGTLVSDRQEFVLDEGAELRVLVVMAKR